MCACTNEKRSAAVEGPVPNAIFIKKNQLDVSSNRAR